jgi:hypothetical protein
VSNDSEILRRALRRMATPEPRPGFVDRALVRAAGTDRPHAHRPVPARGQRWRAFVGRWETWVGAALGGAVAATLTLVLLRPVGSGEPQPLAIALTLHEARDIDVLIDSERALKNATIHVAASGSVALDGFDDEQEIGWHADLERGSNLLSLPVVARSAGKGRLVAIVEHEGRTRRVTIDLTVLDTVSRT